DACGSNRILYNKCGDRHCSNCGRLDRKKWLEKVIGWDMPTTFFQTAFTAPHQLNSLFAINQKECYDLFFRCVHTTLLERTQREFHCKPGLITALHTWGQRLFQHVHIHAIMTAGGESLGKDTKHWVGIDADAPQMEAKSLGNEFSGHFVAGLKELFANDKLELPEDADWNYVDDQESFAYWVDQLLLIDWQAHSESTPETSVTTHGCIHYTGRYVRGGAIHNGRIVDDDGMYVTFRYKDYRDNNKIKEERIRGGDFVARYVQHIVPKGLHRIRYGGLLTGSVRGKNLDRVRPLIRAYNVANRDKLHPALLNDTYNTFESDIENPEDLVEEPWNSAAAEKLSVVTNPAPSCVVCGAENMRHLGYRDANETRADIQRLNHYIGFFGETITTLDPACKQINQAVRLALPLMGKYQQPSFKDFEYSERCASVFAVVWSWRFERSPDTRLDPKTIDAIHIQPAPESPASASASSSKLQEIPNGEWVRDQTTSEYAVGQLVPVIGQAGLLATMVDSVIDTLDGIVQAIVSNIFGRRETGGRRLEGIEISQSQWLSWFVPTADSLMSKACFQSVHLASQSHWTSTRTECCRGVPVETLPLPEW
ncbi:MAG: transposase, partial [Pirellula sp.]